MRRDDEYGGLVAQASACVVLRLQELNPHRLKPVLLGAIKIHRNRTE